MKKFSELYARLDATTSTSRKVEAMVEYFRSARREDAAWAVFFLSGQRLRRIVGPRKLAEWARAEVGIPSWLLEECYAATGDLSETVTLLLPDASARDERPLAEWAEALRDLAGQDDDEQRRFLEDAWRRSSGDERFLLHKMLTGALRVGVSRLLVVRALAKLAGLDRDVVQHRLSGDFEPSGAAFEGLIAKDDGAADVARLYPFFLASPVENVEELGRAGEFFVEWKWDGIRAQVVRRADALFLWSRGEERIEERFPDVVAASAALPNGTVIDGELVVWDENHERPASFAVLQTRINRKRISKKRLAEQPAAIIGYDLLEEKGEDIRALPLGERRARLEAVMDALPEEARRVFRISERVTGKDWTELSKLRASARSRGVEGLMLKRIDSPYRTGRRRGDWWKWKLDPLSLDCVLTFAQAGSGKRAGRFTDYTFGIWSAPAGQPRELVTVAKAYSGLDDEEIAELDRWVRRHTLERFGPVRSVEAEHVFEIGFEGMRASKRHKAGLALRFPRILRWRRDKDIESANSLEDARQLLALYDV